MFRSIFQRDVIEVMADDFIDKCYEMGFSSKEITEVFERKLKGRL